MSKDAVLLDFYKKHYEEKTVEIAKLQLKIDALERQLESVMNTWDSFPVCSKCGKHTTPNGFDCYESVCHECLIGGGANE